MLNFKHLALVLCFLVVNLATFAQLGFSHEIGVIVGPVEFRSDYGIRNNEPTNLGNSGIGIGIIHYINFSYRADCNCYSTDTYFNDHFKLRNEVSWNYTNLDHFGRWVAPNRTSANADRLRAHHGVAENFDIGTQLEYFPKSIRSFQGFAYRFAPFISLGIHYTSYSPQSWSTYNLPNGVSPEQNVYNPNSIYSYWYADDRFLPPVPAGEIRKYPIDLNKGDSWSMVTSVGVRYKLGPLSDLMLDLRWQLYFSDWVDGFNHELERYNKFNDWLIWLNFGYIYYLD